MKPTPDQMYEWRLKAFAELPVHDEYHRTYRIAELAAQWGAAQAQQTNNCEAALRILTKWEKWALSVEADERNTDLIEALAEIRAAQAQQTTVEEPELPEPAYLYDEAEEIFYRPSKAPADTSLLHLYTAVQMHDHFQAGVRAGAAGSQDAKRWRMLVEMESKMAAAETLRYYIINPDKLDYVEKLTTRAKAAVQGGKQ